MARWCLDEVMARSRDVKRPIPIPHACLIVMKLCHAQKQGSVMINHAGDVAVVGPHMDVFGLGVVLYELLTGEKPLVSAVEERAWRLGWLTMPPPSELSERVPLALEAVVLRALERNPAKRYATIEDLHAALERFVSATGAVCSRTGLRDWLAELYPECSGLVEWMDDDTEKITVAC